MDDMLLPIVMSRTPQRISFAGGGTDIKDYYEKGYGAVISSTIDKYVYVTVKPHAPIFHEQFRLNYAESEIVDRIDDIRNDIARECLRLAPIDSALYISVVSDTPGQSGLGGSSSFAIGLLKALHALRGERVSATQLVDEAVRVEVEMLRRPIGKQDQVAVAFGGFNYIRFEAGGDVMIAPVQMDAPAMRDLFRHLQLFWTGMSRDAGDVLREQADNTPSRMAELDAIREQAEILRGLMRDGVDIAAFGRALDEGWRLKRRLATAISNDRIDRWYDAAIAAGALGGKLCGAGGGGFLLFVTPKDRQAAVSRALPDLMETPARFEQSGTRLTAPFAD